MPKPVGARSAMIQQEATQASERKEISNAATDEMPQPVGSCKVIGNMFLHLMLPTGGRAGSSFGKRLDTAAPREMTTVRWTPSTNSLAL